MKILLTGVTGYVGKRLLPVLVKAGHQVVCSIRDINRFNPPKSLQPRISIIEMDLLDEAALKKIPKDIDGAYYLVHSMAASYNYKSLERKSAINFKNALRQTRVKQVIYLSGITNEKTLSEHLRSRKEVEDVLKQGAEEGSYAFTSLRAGIIIGSGSASFEIIRDLVEKLPIMVAPKWLKTKCQPIGIADVISYLSKSLFNPITYDRNFDIGGADILTYQEMLLGFAKNRNLKRRIFVIPIMTPKLSAYWLYFVTSTSYKLATSLVSSMRVEVVCRSNNLSQVLGIKPIGYEVALKRAFNKIENNAIVSSWKDSYSSSGISFDIADFIKVPTFGCFVDQRKKKITNRALCLNKIWSIGGKTGWYYANWLWQLRGFLDKMGGGVGLRRGRTSLTSINPGDTLDFWRVLYADKKNGHLLLLAEMKLPGEAWLEFKIENDQLIQTATFRPLGLLGRLYWYLVLPFHGFIFNGMLREITKA